ncbi:WD40 repeat-like protein [Agrocybe pediades]|nr:WD40 repeat-like protein [Agrocybe pediades]
MNATALTLPVVTIQDSFPQVVQDVEDGLVPLDKFWVSCYKASEPSVHAKINAELDERDRNLVVLKPSEGEVDVVKDSNGTYRVSCKPLGVPPTKVVTPVQEYKDEERSNPTKPHRITAFDVSPDSSRFATGYLDGSVFLYPTKAFKHPRQTLIPTTIDVTKSKTPSRPHLSGVSSLKFFPSSRVLLSSGLDFSLTILPTELPEASSASSSRIQPVRTMRAHTRTVTDTAIIAQGRNIVSSSLDSAIKLWDVSSGEVITSIYAQSAISSMSLGDRLIAPPDGEESIPPPATDSREIPETGNKVVFCGLQSGKFEMLDLGFKKSVYTSAAGSTGALNTIAYSQPMNLLATGSSKGLVTVYDTRFLDTPLTSFKRLDTSIEGLAFIRRAGDQESVVELAVATSDGLPYIASVVPEGPMVDAELVGVDCDPVRNVTVREENGRFDVWSASDDGIVRRYAF